MNTILELQVLNDAEDFSIKYLIKWYEKGRKFYNLWPYGIYISHWIGYSNNSNGLLENRLLDYLRQMKKGEI